MLNMTEVSFAVDAASDAMIVVRVDLGQSELITPEAYWAAVAASPSSKQQKLIEPVLKTVASGVEVFIDGEKRELALGKYEVTAISLEAIKNPFTPQMAQIQMAVGGPKPTEESSLEIRITDSLEVPWPCLVRVDSYSPLPLSRLLTSSTRSSGALGLNVSAESSSEGFVVTAVLRMQDWLPSITWLVVGAKHIIPMGLDHVVFILGLFFLSTKLTSLLLQVTAFTVAHSLTLGLTTLGFIAVPADIVEPLIAASILYVAIDNLYSSHVAKWRLVVVMGFGLLHGLGFASALSDLALPEGSTLIPLLLFNLGVEIGQIAVLLSAYMVFGWFQNWPAYRKRVAEPASVTIAGIGLYWLIKRLAY